MPKHVFLFLALLMAVPAWSQVQPSATGDLGSAADDESRMTVPPVASGMLYPSVAGADERSNYLTGSVSANGAYTDNVLPSGTARPIADWTVSIAPSLSLNRTTSRQQTTISYNPSFTFYKEASALNSLSHSITATYQGRLTPHSTIALQDVFTKTSNVFSTGYPFIAGGLNGSTQAPVPVLIVPYAEQTRNNASAELTYQFSPRGMVGGSGVFTNFRYPNKAQSPGIFDSDSTSGSGFYNRRLTKTQYLGMMYQYTDVLSYPPTSRVETQIHAFLPFYTLSFRKNFTVSLAGGAQRIRVMERQPATVDSLWAPQATASFGWQNEKASLTATYLHSTAAGQGLLGAFNSNSGNLLGTWKFSRSWTGSAAFSYQETDLMVLLAQSSYPGGHSVLTDVSLLHSVGDHLSIQAGYDRLHQQYSGLAIITANPDANREFVAITYNFTKSLGR